MSANQILGDDLIRPVWCVAGIPIDLVNTEQAVSQIKSAAAGIQPFLFSTPNLNFLIACGRSQEFRDSLLGSDLCLADGISLTCIARLLGIPLLERVAGSDLFEAIRKTDADPPLRVFFFGGTSGAAAAAQAEINSRQEGLICVGHLNPGWGALEEMSSDKVIDEVNGAGAQFLVAALGAYKGQIWLWRNHTRLSVPVRAHLGATLNFIIGRVKRAPRMLRKVGLEWLWRIKEEPQLWRRYWSDGISLIGLLVFHILPLALIQAAARGRKERGLHVRESQAADVVTLYVSGNATQRSIQIAIDVFRQAAHTKKDVSIDLSAVACLDARFLGVLLMLRKQLLGYGRAVRVVKPPRTIRRIFKLQRLGFLLAD